MIPNSLLLQPRQTFLEATRRIRLYFATGSPAKLAQATFVFNRLGMPLSGSQPADGSGIEDYVGGAHQLVMQKLRDVKLGSHTAYFVEDTYVRIEALSAASDAPIHSPEWAHATQPGLRTKEWFQEVEFPKLDAYIRSVGGNRRATVYSTIALSVPGVSSAQIFTGSTSGEIAATPGSGLTTNRTFPWLSERSFNAWFIPDGADVPLSDLEIEQSIDFDFRVSALLALAGRIEEYIAMLNLSPVSVQLVPRRLHGVQQMPLFSTRPAPIVVVGHTCAGKTTLGQLLRKHDYEHVEASSILKLLQPTATLPNSRPGYFQAMATLSAEGWDIIAKRALELYAAAVETGICITGLRTLEELHYMATVFPDMIVVLLEAPEETRYERYMRRGREGDSVSLARFKEREQEHASFGLIGVADHCAAVRIANASTMEDLDALAGLLAQKGINLNAPGVSRRGIGLEAVFKSQIYRCAVALANANEPLSPSQIESHQRISKQLPVVKRNAVRKVVTEFPTLIRRVGEKDGTAFYAITEHGRTYIALMDLLHSKAGYAPSSDIDSYGIDA